MRILVILLALICCVNAYGDSFMPSEPEVFSSPSGKYLVRIEAANSVENAQLFWEHTEFNVFSYDEVTETYKRITKFDVEGHPLQLFINDSGTHIVTIDQHFGVGYGQIAAIYDFQGKRLAEWTLAKLFNVKNIFDPRLPFPRFRQSTSSIYWRGETGWDHGQKSIWISPPTKSELREDGSYTVIHPSDMESYVIDLEKLEMRRVPPKNLKAEPASGQPAIRPNPK